MAQKIKGAPRSKGKGRNDSPSRLRRRAAMSRDNNPLRARKVANLVRCCGLSLQDAERRIDGTRKRSWR